MRFMNLWKPAMGTRSFVLANIYVAKPFWGFVVCNFGLEFGEYK